MAAVEARTPPVPGQTAIAAPDRLVARNFFALGSGEAIARLIAFAATIYLARTLGASLYGVIGFATAVVLYASRIADGGIEFFGLGVREVAEDPRRAGTVGPPVLTVRLAVSAVLSLALIGAGLLLPQPDGSVLAAYGLTLLAIGGSTRWIHYGLQHASLVATARAGGEGVMVLLVILLVRDAGDVVAVPLAQFVGDGLAMIFLAAWLRRVGVRLPVRFDWAVAGPLFRRSWKLVASALLGLLIYNSDLILLRVFRTSAAVGYYAVGYALISFLLNLGSAYAMSLLPTLTRLGREPSAQRSLYHTSMAQVFAVGIPVAVGGCVLAPQIIGLIFGAQYGDSILPLQILIWSIPLSLLREVPSAALMARNREDRVLRLTVLATVFNLALNFALIPTHGMVGAAVSTVLTEIARYGLALWFARDEGFTGMPLHRYWRAAIAVATMAGGLWIVLPAPVWVAIPIGAIVYAGGLALLGGIRLHRKGMPTLHV